MVSCDHCGLPIEKQKALMAGAGGSVKWFCDERCQAAPRPSGDTAPQPGAPFVNEDREHRRLMALVTELRRQLGIAGRPPVDTSWRPTFRALLERFITRLQEHFTGEESRGGFFWELLARDATLDADVGRLRHDHSVLSEWGRDLLDQATAEDVSLADFVAEANAWLHGLGRHERAENLLLCEASRTLPASDRS